VIKHVVTRWQTRGVHIGTAQVNVPVSVEESDVIAESASVELRVLEDPDHCVLLVVKLLRGIEATGVPLTNSHLQEVILLEVLELVGGSDDLPGGGVVVVAEVVRDDGAAADEVIVLVEQQTGPGELPRGAVTMITTCHPAGLPGAACLTGAPHILPTALSPLDKCVGRLGVQALDAEHAEVDAGVVAAGLLTHWTCGLLRVGVGHGSVDNPGADS